MKRINTKAVERAYPLLFGEEVCQAAEEGKPIVALESTIISHGMPWPQNMETAEGLEEAVRSAGAVPATIAVIDGLIRIGISKEQLDFLSTGKGIVKASRRDLPVVFAKKMSAATTVAATMIAASMAGIKLFATGGVGGVHRGAPSTFDISADLQELAKTNVAVVCAGVKAILDLPLTMEYLETMGVPVLGFGTDELPAFYSRKSGISLEYRIDSYEEGAHILDAKWKAGLSGGVLITNPIPEAHSMETAKINGAIEAALAEADRLNIRGKKITPFLLDKVKSLTEGESLTANIALVKNNATVAAGIAKALSEEE
ncbi:pseudouridine-5'-phosphate glycosidase [Sediminispirochaeta smaragdinae]|uniref:Pseudouridine-5'-phosphate glycosidase n=1 Tax=Sediminispirochaeta smaragdinae (strain DSM 11293 / JCM 15392 / SEBR 4228) TaxID=573413 RepID=E1R959_SEDSS|nr:pseudouridine-5'-phosphate glycosidase [Sediminispirochaeta smaragdinae]ADK83028.1 Indigoidine synthase A family protein [Sediminispirochaeta smaragdinae DSM 11293]